MFPMQSWLFNLVLSALMRNVNNFVNLKRLLAMKKDTVCFLLRNKFLSRRGLFTLLFDQSGLYPSSASTRLSSVSKPLMLMQIEHFFALVYLSSVVDIIRGEIVDSAHVPLHALMKWGFVKQETVPSRQRVDCDSTAFDQLSLFYFHFLLPVSAFTSAFKCSSRRRSFKQKMTSETREYIIFN